MSASTAEVIPLGQVRPQTYGDAVEAYLRSAGIGESSKRIYRISLTTWAWLACGLQPPLGKDRRGAKAPTLWFAALADPASAELLAGAFVERARLVDADTVNRELSIMKAAIGWWLRRGLLADNPIRGIERRPAPPDRTKALSPRSARRPVRPQGRRPGEDPVEDAV
ncbi:hypothetical protein [Nonomuraea sp. LPB2021202275-12-8]|uniref:hypothetical protein n=1 Tax=Nonomuraea sp. LPB2021202275-12-8 TaxID=3120159 RepID=UPI00300CC51C